ncbi:MAG: ABC transporter permease subunit [Spirochaetia bacterium]|jgi:ABC-type glycerol-3-phosphate transport system permease component|nr:ABC transporter permease subunit [Spirochaetia bacterium]
MDNLRLAPLVALVALAGVAPFLSALRNSFYLGDAFAGMANYRQLLADRGFPMAAAITIGWSLLSATTTLAIAYPLASLAMASRRAYAILFPLFVAMWAVPVYIGAPLWRFVLHGAAGDSVFRTLTGIEINLMNSPVAAFLSTAMVASWFRLPQAVLILIAALGRSRQSIDDAARADGAGPAALAFTIHLPAMSGAIAAIAALELVSAFKEFTVPFLMTAGGPPLLSGITNRTVVGATTTLEIYLYDLFSGYADSGIVSAYAVVLSLAVGLTVALGFLLRAAIKRRGSAARYNGQLPRRIGRVPGRIADIGLAGSSWLIVGVLVSAALVLAFCILWMAFSGLSVAFVDSLIPRFFTTANFYKAFFEDGLALALANTLYVSTLTAALVGLAAFPAAAWLADRPRAKAAAFFVVLQALSSSGGVHSLIPLYDLWRRLGLLGGYAPVVLVYLYHSLPVALFALTEFMRDQPPSFKEAARLEGLGTFGYLWRIQLPLAMPAIGATAMVAFLSAWNGFMAPLVFLDDDATYTIAVRLHAYVGSIASGSPRWNLFAAASIVNIAIVGLLFRFFKKPLANTALSDQADD